MQKFVIFSFDKIKPSGRHEGTAPSLEAAINFVGYLEKRRDASPENFKSAIGTQFRIFEMIEGQSIGEPSGGDLTDDQRERLEFIDKTLLATLD